MYKRSIFVINPRFQYKFCFFVCSIIILCSAMYPFGIYEFTEALIRDPNILLPSNFKQNRDNLLVWLVIIQLLLLGISFIICIFLSHKIAGPMYKLQNHLRGIKDGGEVKPVFFRDGDNFPEIAEEVSETLEHFLHQRQEDFAYLDEVSAYINNLSLVVPEDKKPVLNEIQSNLAKIQSRYQG